MKNLILIFVSLFICQYAAGDAGIFQTYIVLDIDGGGNAFYGGGINPEMGTPFNNQTYTPTTSAKIIGGEVKTFKNGTSDVTGARLYYHFYKVGNRTGVFTEIDLPFNADLGGGNQKWQSLVADIDLIALAIASGNGAGEYKLEVYWQMLHNSQGAINPEYDSNFGNNFIGTFNLSAALLPIELIYFDVNKSKTSNELVWQTASENNNSHFNIERSSDSKKWDTIGKVTGHGNSLEKKEYQFIDTNPHRGINYYRLKQVDFDGQFEYSKVVSIDFEKENKAVIYPNPVDGNLFIGNIKNIEGGLDVFIYDTQNRLVKNNFIQSENNITVGDLLPGVYFVKIKDQTGFYILNERFVKK